MYHSFIDYYDDFRIYRGLSIATFDCQRVYDVYVVSTKRGLTQDTTIWL
jgi:hypothetical protein